MAYRAARLLGERGKATEREKDLRDARRDEASWRAEPMAPTAFMSTSLMRMGMGMPRVVTGAPVPGAEAPEGGGGAEGGAAVLWRRWYSARGSVASSGPVRTDAVDMAPMRTADLEGS